MTGMTDLPSKLLLEPRILQDGIQREEKKMSYLLLYGHLLVIQNKLEISKWKDTLLKLLPQHSFHVL